MVSHEQQVVAQHRLLATLLAFGRSQNDTEVFIELDIGLVALTRREVVLAKRDRVREATSDASSGAAVAAFDRGLEILAADLIADIQTAFR